MEHPILARLSGVRQRGAGVIARCPAHEDRVPSLKVDLAEDGRVLLHCFAGCSSESIVAALGMTMADLFEARPLAIASNGHGPETRYLIRDVDGTVVAIHTRREQETGKRFLWQRPGGEWGLGGTKSNELPLYGAHELGLHDRVLVTEGEKSRDALVAAGFAAVGTVTGADGTPGRAALMPLVGRTVVLWPDNDSAGVVHMDRLAAALVAAGQPEEMIERVTWKEAPAGGDAADCAREDLVALVLDATPWFGTARTDESPSVSFVSAPVAVEGVLDVAPVPEICRTGWLGEYVALVDPLSEAPTAFHVASGLTMAGAVIGRGICNRYVSKNVYANCFMLLVGLAGTSRKDTAIRMALDLPSHVSAASRERLSEPWHLSTDIGSAEGMIRVLSERSNTLLWITEFQRLVRNAKRQATTTIFPLMTAAWDTPIKLENVTKNNALEAKFPYLSVLAAIQPGILAREFGQEEISSGFATRWLYVVGASDRSLPEPPDIDAEAAFALWRQLVRTIALYGGVAGNEVRLHLTPAARKRWIAWYEADRARPVASEDEDSMRSRLGVQIRKVALIYAVCAGARSIELDHLEPAIAFVEWCWAHTVQLMRQWGIGVGQDIEARIERVLTRRGPMRRRDLQMACSHRRWSGREFAQILDAMLRNQTVVADPLGRLAWSE